MDPIESETGSVCVRERANETVCERESARVRERVCVFERSSRQGERVRHL